MKLYQNVMMLGLAGVLTLSCSNGTEATTEKSKPETTDNIGEEASDTKSDKVLEIYFDIKDALVESNAVEATLQASELLKLEELEGSSDDLIQSLKKIAETDDLAAQRASFQVLSKAMYDRVKAHNHSGETVYRQFCPMAFKNEGGYWLSKDEEIMNPYFGDMMLHCGKVEEKI